MYALCSFTISTESSTSSYNSTKRKAGEHHTSTLKKPTDGLKPKSSKTTKSLYSHRNHVTDGGPGTSKTKATNEVETKTRTAIDDKNFSNDKFSGLRIVNPLLSSVVMENRMEGRRMVKISQIPTKIKGNDIDGDWVTIGVIVQKMPPKKSSNVRILLYIIRTIIMMMMMIIIIIIIQLTPDNLKPCLNSNLPLTRSNCYFPSGSFSI